MANPVNIDFIHESNISRMRRNSELRRERYLDELANTKEISLKDTPTKAGDRTDNTPPLRMHSRRSMRFDKELSTRTYLVEERGKYWFRDAKHTMAVITKARMIMASNTPVKHPVDEEGRSPKLLG